MFERFTPQARTTVVSAQEQARELGHDYIGTEHLLLSLLAPGEANLATHVLADLGVRHGDVQRRILDIVGMGEGARQGHIPFTPRAKKVLELSLREALRLKQKSIGPEHVLLGVVREGEGLAAQILVDLGAELPKIREELQWRVAAKGKPGTRVLDPRIAATTPGGAQAADRAVARAAATGSPLASQHYLLGLLDAEHSLAAKILAELGVSREAVEAKLDELSAAGTTDEPPDVAAARRTELAVEGDTVVVRLIEPQLADRLRPVLAEHQGPLPGLDGVWKAVSAAIDNLINRLRRAS